MNQVIKAYDSKKLNKNYKYPLVMIQLSDKTPKSDEEDKTSQILKILENQKIHKNHIAIWLSNDHRIASDKSKSKDVVSLKDKIINDSNIRFLIFKQAIATGWDIPRANIWVKLREIKNDAFQIQTMGRVLRNQFKKYYNNPLIDSAFIFNNDKTANLEICESFGEENTYKVNDYNRVDVFKK